MFTSIYLLNLLLISQVSFSNAPMAVDCTGRPDIVAMQREKMAANRSNSSRSYRFMSSAVASRDSAFSPRQPNAIATRKYSYTSPSNILPPTGRFSESFSAEQSVRTWRGLNPEASKPLWYTMLTPPTSPNAIFSLSYIRSASEKPFANYNLSARNTPGIPIFPASINSFAGPGANYTASRTISGNDRTREQYTYRLIDLSTGGVLQEWHGGMESNLRYGGQSQWNWGGHKYFMNHGGYFQNH